MATARRADRQGDLDAGISKLAEDVRTHVAAIADAEGQVAQLQLDLQRASQERRNENLQFQKTMADQAVSIEVLKKASARNPVDMRTLM